MHLKHFVQSVIESFKVRRPHSSSRKTNHKINQAFLCLYYRLPSDFISEDRKEKLKSKMNRKAIKEKIILSKTSILDRLHEDRIITLEDKEIIEVRM